LAALPVQANQEAVGVSNARSDDPGVKESRRESLFLSRLIELFEEGEHACDRRGGQVGSFCRVIVRLLARKK
jgi:hypothetical protein